MNLFATLAILLAVGAQQGAARCYTAFSSSSTNSNGVTETMDKMCCYVGGTLRCSIKKCTNNVCTTDGDTGSTGSGSAGSSGNQGSGTTKKEGCYDKFNNCKELCEAYPDQCTCSCEAPKEKECKTNAYNLGALASQCGDSRYVRKCRMTEADKKAVVDTHNELRQKVASGRGCNDAGTDCLPRGTIGDLTWDDGLAEAAQEWLNNCIFGHNKPETANYAKGTIGQNAHWAGASYDPRGLGPDNLVGAVNDWYNEIRDYIYYDCTPRSFDYYGACIAGQRSIYGNKGQAQIGHFTQVIWGETKKVGCGWIQYKKGSSWETLITCNYGRGGNMGNQPVYNIA